jgi:hypothetical protein
MKKDETSTWEGARKGAWERGLVMRGRRAEQSEVQQNQGCLIWEDRQTKTATKLQPEGRHRLPGGKCRQKLKVGKGA